MAIAYVNGSLPAGSGAASGLTWPTAAFNAVAGNTIIVFAQAFGVGVDSVADTAGNAYTNKFLDATTGQECWVAENITGNASNVVTVTYDSSATYRVVGAAQYSGLATSGSYDKQNGRITSAATSHVSTSITPTEAESLIVGWWVSYATPQTLSAGANTTLRLQEASSDAALGDRIVSSVAGYTVELTTGVAADYAVVTAVFKAPVGDPGTTVIPQSPQTRPLTVC